MKTIPSPREGFHNFNVEPTPSPQGFSSLPCVSEAFTPNTTFNPQQQSKKTKPNTNRFNMLTQHTQKFTTYAICKHIDPLSTLSQCPSFNFHDMRENMA